MKALEEERDVIRARGIKLEEGRRTGSKATPWEAPTPTSYCNSPGREERKGQAANRPGKGMQAGPPCPAAFLLVSHAIFTRQLEALLGNLLLK